MVCSFCCSPRSRSSSSALGSVAAQEDDDAAQTLHLRVNNEYLGEDGEEVREGVPDVRITVESEAGEPIAEGVTGEDGTVDIGIVDPGTYVISIDTDSLPEGFDRGGG